MGKSTWLVLRRTLNVLGLLAGLVLLYGRYDWSAEEAPFSFRSYVLSAYLLLLFLPIFHFFLKLWVCNQRIAMTITVFTGIVFCLPYQWLGLRKYLQISRVYFDSHTSGLPAPSLQWFPGSLHQLPSIPNEVLCFGLLLALGLGVIRLRFPLLSRQGKWSIGVFFLLVLQTWAHLSMRSPYTYIPHFEQPPENHYWYHYYLFPEGQGAVNQDYPVFRDAEEVFIGSHRELTVLANRMFPAFLGAQISGFLNPFYVWLFLNVGFWALGVYSIYYLGKHLFGKWEAIFAALLMTSAQGIILYVGQPKIYTVAISGISILLAAQHFLFRESSRYRTLIFGVLFGLFLLCYEGQPWVMTVPLIAWTLGFDLRRTLFGIFLGILISSLFVWLLSHVGQTNIRPSLVTLGGTEPPLEHIWKMIGNGEFARFSEIVISARKSFVHVMGHAFRSALIPAVLGILFAQARRKFLVSLLVPAALTWWLMELGENFVYIQFPRLVYSAYPAIFLASGVFLAGVAQKIRPRLAPRLGRSLAWLFISANFTYMNLDVWGYPEIYYTWFYRDSGYTEVQANP